MRAWTVLTAVLLLLALVRGAAVVYAQPLLGVGNNYDMIRVQGCIDAYPVRDAAVPPANSSPEAPLARYAFRDDVHPGCYWTSAVVLAYAAMPAFAFDASHGDGSFSIRRVGLAGLLVTLAIASVLSIAWLRRGLGAAAALHAGLVLIVLMDPANTLYLNGFYAEYTAVLCLYAAIAGAALLVSTSRRPGAIALGLLALALALLAASKVQHSALGALIAGIVAALRLADARVPWRVVAALAIGGFAGLAFQVVHLRQADMASMGRANITNTVFHAFLAQARDPVATAARLDLPPACAQYAGKSWFSPGMQQPHACPQVFDVGRARLLSLMWREPALVARVVAGGVVRTRPWLPHLGVVEGEYAAPLPERVTTIGRFYDGLPLPVYLVLLLAPILIVPALLWRDRGPRRFGAAVHVVLAIAALLPLPIVVTIVFGDGYADTAKQAHLIASCVLTFWGTLLAATVARWRDARPLARPR